MIEALDAWRPLLVELGDLGEVLADAIEQRDTVRAIAATMQMRDVRAALSRVEAKVEIRGERAEIEGLLEVSGLVGRARGAEAIANRWHARELPGDPILLGSPLGAAILVDRLLPEVWDRETDLVVLVGEGFALAAELLHDLGQRRIIAMHGTTAGGALVVESDAELATAVRMQVPLPPTRTVVRGALGMARAEVESAKEVVAQALSDLRIHRNTVQAFSRTWIDHGLTNLPAIARSPSIATVGDRLRGLPMVIVAPGPSLARNAAQLRELRGRALICAFSHSLKPVIAAGVTPDLVLTVDPQDVRYHFESCDVSQTTLVNAATVHPALFELPAQRLLALSANCAIDDWIFAGTGESVQVPGGGSVATTAFSLALRWGCDPIVFVGLDLSFPNGAYYVPTSHDGGARAVVDASGTMRVEGWSAGFQAMKATGGPSSSAERAIELPGWAAADEPSGTVPSSFMFSLFHRWFLDRLRAPDATATRVYNCTEGGAFIRGMQHRALADVIAELPADGVALDTQLAGLAVEPARTKRALAQIATFATALARTRKLARAALELAKTGDSKQLARVERALAAALRPIGFVSLLAQREIERAQDVAARADQDYLAASRALFTTLLDVIDQLSPQIATALAA